jgi:hypothetical protein
LGAIREVNSCLLSGGALDSQVHHRTCTIQCPVQIAFLNWCSRPLKIWSRWRTGQSGAPIRPLARPHVTRGLHGRPLAHRTVRCTTGQSDAPPDSPMIFSHTLLTVSRERRLRCRRLTGQSSAPPDSLVHPDRAAFWLYTSNFSPKRFLLFLALRHNTLVFKTMY